MLSNVQGGGGGGDVHRDKNRQKQKAANGQCRLSLMLLMLPPANGCKLIDTSAVTKREKEVSGEFELMRGRGGGKYRD